MPKLWTKNFTILTLGTVVSMLGTSISAFAIGLMVLDNTGNSVLSFATFLVAYNVPKIIAPMLFGPYLDNFSRVKTIYFLDFVSAGLFFLVFFLISNGLFSYWPFLAMAVLVGTIDSTYQVAYDSFYPTLIPEGMVTKAYSISSIIGPLAAGMIPVAAILYGTIGVAPMFLFNAITFLIAAIFETQIKASETHVERVGHFTLDMFWAEVKSGARYIGSQKSLVILTIFTFVTMFAAGAELAITLPFFKSNIGPGVVYYTVVMGMGVVGRLVAGAVNYRVKIPMDKRLAVALLGGAITFLMLGIYLYLPVIPMILCSFIAGFLTIVVNNLRVSSVQTFIPDRFRARFTGAFQMFITVGTISGQLMAGALADRFSPRLVLTGFMVVSLLALLLPLAKRRLLMPLYNRDV